MKALLIVVLCSFLALTGTAQTDNGNRTQMTNTEFNQFLQSVQNQDLQYFAREDVESMKDTFIYSDKYFSTAQIRRLLSLVEKDSGKLALARLLYSRVTDPVNFIRLSDLFKIDTYRDEFIAWCNGPDKTYYKTVVTL